MLNTSTEDKIAYCYHASDIEEPKFVEFFNSLSYSGFKIQINPEKQNDKFTCDLLVNGDRGDLKTQDTPFYKAEDWYKLDPQWAVTYNEKDYLRYKKTYSSKNIPFYVVFDVKRKKEFNTKYDVQITPMRGIFIADLRRLEFLIEKEKIPLHTYLGRVDDNQGNAKSSYIFDIRKLRMVYYEGSSVFLK